MKFDRVLFILLLICLVVLYNLWQSNEQKDIELIALNGKMYELMSRQVEVKDSIVIVTEYKKGDVITVEKQIPVVVPTVVDTLSILKEFYAVNTFLDTLSFGKQGQVSIIDTISQNVIISRSYTADLNYRIISETITIRDLPKTHVWAGLAASSNVAVGATVSIVTKQDTHIGLDVGLGVQEYRVAPYVGVRYLWRIK